MKKIILSAITALGLSMSTNAQSFFEGFELSMLSTGWDTLNLSGPTPGASEAWFPSNYFTAPPTAPEGSEYFCANYQAVGGSDTISDWLFTPTVLLKNGDQFMFYTRTLATTVAYPDRMEIRLSKAGSGMNAGTGPNTVGTYTTLLGTINQALTLTGYPNTFQKYMYTLSGLPAGGVTGRFAFRYFVEDAGPLGNNSDAIGVDSVYYQPTIATTISSAANTNFFKIYPNPSSGLVKLNFKTFSEDREVIVQNMIGTLMFREKVGSLENSIDLSNLAKGIYLINVKQNGIVYTEKLTIE